MLYVEELQGYFGKLNHRQVGDGGVEWYGIIPQLGIRYSLSMTKIWLTCLCKYISSKAGTLAPIMLEARLKKIGCVDWLLDLLDFKM